MASNWNQREKHLNLDGNVNSPTKILENSVCVSIKVKEREVNNTWKRLKKGESFFDGIDHPNVLQRHKILGVVFDR